MSTPFTLSFTRARWRDNDADVNGTPNWLADEDAAVSIGVTQTSTVFRLRAQVDETGGSKSGSVTPRIERNYNGTSGWAQVTTSSTYLKIVDGAEADNTAITLAMLTAPSGSFTNGEYDESVGETAAISLGKDDYTEVEFAVQIQSGMSASDYIDVRITNAGTTMGTHTVRINLTAGATYDESVQTSATGAEAGDTQAVDVTFETSVADTADAGDTQAVDVTFETSIADTAEASDDWVDDVTKDADWDEGADAGDTFAVDVTFEASWTEGGKGGDTPGSLGSVYDSPAVSDTAEAGDTFDQVLAGRAVLTYLEIVVPDTLPAGTGYRYLEEGALAGDTFYADPVGDTWDESFSDGAEASDSYVLTVEIPVETTDGAEAGETFANDLEVEGAVTDGALAADSWSSLASIYNPVVTDGAEAGDSWEAGLLLEATWTEGADAGDDWDAEITLENSVTEGALAADSWAVDVTFEAAVTEGALAGDLFDADPFTREESWTEGAEASDSWLGGLVIDSAWTEGALAGDSAAVLATFEALLADGARAGDTFLGGLVLEGAWTDGALAGDLFAVAAAALESGSSFVALRLRPVAGGTVQLRPAADAVNRTTPVNGVNIHLNREG